MPKKSMKQTNKKYFILLFSFPYHLFICLSGLGAAVYHAVFLSKQLYLQIFIV